MKSTLRLQRSRTLVLAILLTLLSSCTGTGTKLLQQARANSSALLTLELGMSPDVVMERMGEGTTRVMNPYRSQQRRMDDGTEVLILHYYTEYTGRVHRTVPSRCLTPIVFEDGLLVGWGSQFFEEIVQKFELRIR